MGNSVLGRRGKFRSSDDGNTVFTVIRCSQGSTFGSGSLRPLPETEHRYPWTRWAYFFGIGAVMFSFIAFIGACVIGTVAM